MLVVVVGSNIMDDCQSSCRSYVFRHCRVGRHVRLSFVVWVVLWVIVSAMCWWSLSGQSSWTTVRHRVGRKFFVVVWSVVMDDCQSSCRSYVFCRDCCHGRLSLVVSVVCFLSFLSSRTTVRRRVSRRLGRHVGDRLGRMLVVVVGSIVMDDCQSSCRSYVFCRVGCHGELSDIVSVVKFSKLSLSVVMDDCQSSCRSYVFCRV